MFYEDVGQNALLCMEDGNIPLMETARPLRSTRILVAEDDAMIAFDLTATLQKAGAEVIGPGATLKHTLSLVKTPLLSAAILDVNLRDEDVFPAALALEGLGVGFVFHTDWASAGELGRTWPKVEALRKPAPPELLIDALLRACKARAVPVAPIS